MSEIFNHLAIDAFRHFDRAARIRGLGPTVALASRILLREGIAGIRDRLDALGPIGHDPHRQTTEAVILTTPHMLHSAQRLQSTLAETGIEAEISDNDRGAAQAELVFSFAPQKFPAAPAARTIAFQVEQSTLPDRWTPQYLRKLSNFRAVFDYSLTNISAMQDHIPLQRIFYVPFSPAENAKTRQDRSHRVLFYGDTSPDRRRVMLQKISAAVPELEIENNLFGVHLSDRLRETDIVLNLRAAQGGLLETARISEALTHGCLVVSEVSPDQDQFEADRRLIFAPQDDPAALSATLRGLLDDPDKYRHHQLGGNRPQPDLFRSGILRGLQGLRIISPDIFEQLSHDYPQPAQARKGELSRICLTLPETTARTRAFDAQSDSWFFQLWPGMKATPGWRGAALSYRHIMRKLRSAEVTEALVVEDDVLLPEDFERRLRSIRRYMDECDADLFSGMIVDLHKDARVLDVKRRDGMCIVQIDRAVTMICNLYRRRMIDYLAQWNDRDDNAFTNTIDRYMEQATHLKVITTLPFMVDYRSKTPSTLRKSDNSAFDALRAKSEKMLAERVSEFELSASLL